MIVCCWAPADQFGFSWRLACSPRKPRLSAIGFPWILSSETRLINGLCGINRQKFFVTLLPSGGGGPSTALTLLPRGQAGSLIGQAYPDFRFLAINCRLL